MSTDAGRLNALLIVAPFGLIEYPNLAAGLLKTAARAAGHGCDVSYCSLEYAKQVGWETYVYCNYTDNLILLGERVFAPTVFEDQIPSWAEYWKGAVIPYANPVWQGMRSAAQRYAASPAYERISNETPEFLDRYCARPELADYDVFAFTSSYCQQLASLGIAKRLKKRFPDKPIVFGGANCHGVMGTQILKSFPFVDYVCVAEGDLAFPQLLDCIAQGAPVDVPGMVSRAADGQIVGNTDPVMIDDMDSLPFPNFDEFFEAFDFPTTPGARTTAIPLESSRGCWWGEKHHCVFCGLNGETMRYRSKSAERVVAEIEEVAGRYGARRVMMADNILENGASKELLPALSRLDDIEIFFEIKANVSRADVAAMAKANVFRVQPGIESLSTHVLELMDKGCDAFHNLQLLKWAKEEGIGVSWNLLCGFTGETEEDYDAMADLIPKVYHLDPPLGMGHIVIDRFSPLFKWPERYNIRTMPARAYNYVYALPEEDIRNLAYAYTFESAQTSTLRTHAVPGYAQRAHMRELTWQKVYQKAEFSYQVAADGRVSLFDCRVSAEQYETELAPIESRVFLEIDAARTPMAVAKALSDGRGGPVDPDRVREILDDFDRRCWAYSESGKYLALATRRRSESSVGVTPAAGAAA